MAVQVAPDSASNQGDSADDGCFDDDASDPGQSSTSYQCSLAGDLDDDSCMTPQDMALLKALAPDAGPRPRSHPPRLRSFPPGTRPVRLVGEGAANAVFELDAADLNGRSSPLPAGPPAAPVDRLPC